MTATRQRRHKARAAAAAELYRMARIERMLIEARDSPPGARERVYVRTYGLVGSTVGFPTLVEPGVRVWISDSPEATAAKPGPGSNIPWKKIKDVEPA